MDLGLPEEEELGDYSAFDAAPELPPGHENEDEEEDLEMHSYHSDSSQDPDENELR